MWGDVAQARSCRKAGAAWRQLIGRRQASLEAARPRVVAMYERIEVRG